MSVSTNMAGGSILAFFFLFFFVIASPSTNLTPFEQATFTIVTQSPATITVIVATKTGGSLVQISSLSEPLQVMVPTAWQRGAVFGSPLKQFAEQHDAIGYPVYTIPAESGIRFTVPVYFNQLALRHTGLHPLEVHVKQIDLRTRTVIHSTYLLQDEIKALF